MGAFGTPIDTSLIQTAQAQQVASRQRDRERAVTDSTRRFQDIVELRVASVEAAEALRKLPPNDSEQADAEHRANDRTAENDDDGDGAPKHVDVVV